MSLNRREFLSFYGALGLSLLFPKVTFSSSSVKLSNFFNNEKSISILGDSITHGAFAGDITRNGWANLIARAFNVEYGTYSYGYTPYTKLGSGKNESQDVGIFSKSNGWQSLVRADAENFVSGLGYRTSTINSFLVFKIPAFMARALIHYIQQPDGAKFDILINGDVHKTIDSSGLVNNFSCADVDLYDDGSGAIEIKVIIKSGGVFSFSGISYLSSYSESVCNNFSQSGRRLRYTSENVINTICENSSTLILALGHNDAGENAPAYQLAFKNVINLTISACNKYNVNVVVPDFVWSSDESNWVRLELMRLASETSGLYINLPKQIEKKNGVPADRNHLVNTLGMWVDISHPNEEGNKWIFEEVSKAMNLSCQTKEDVLATHNFNFPPREKPVDASVNPSNENSSSGGSFGVAELLGLGAIGYIARWRSKLEPNDKG
ncbi:SGNH/GDSL hydrolase family protein [uncultured Shewanella sp.]|uniref:SGNH/GDSL hydrolase family protein n=1 Tax=uncultured Shewanella sp. TaxID=173975 RepID=UPI0026028ED7|nr:SGNH/GDSL hydrolase family protein [uncultured Shewanella sp.]